MTSHTHLAAHAAEIFNSCVAPSETISLDSIRTSPLGQKALLSSKLDDLQFHPYSTCPPWLSAVELVPRSELNCNSSMESDSFFWFGLLSLSELTDKVLQSATQLLYREITLSKCGVVYTFLPVQQDAI